WHGRGNCCTASGHIGKDWKRLKIQTMIGATLMADKSIYGFDEPSTVVTEVDEHSAACVFSHKPEMGFSIHSLHGEVYIDYGQFVTAALIGGVLKVFCYHAT